MVDANFEILLGWALDEDPTGSSDYTAPLVAVNRLGFRVKEYNSNAGVRGSEFWKFSFLDNLYGKEGKLF